MDIQIKLTMKGQNIFNFFSVFRKENAPDRVPVLGGMLYSKQHIFKYILN